MPAPAACTCLKPCSTGCCLRFVAEQRSSPEQPQRHQPKPSTQHRPLRLPGQTLCRLRLHADSCLCVLACCCPSRHLLIALLCSACLLCLRWHRILFPKCIAGLSCRLGRVEAVLLLSLLGSRNSPLSPAKRASGVQWALQELPAELGSQRRTSSFSATEPCLRQDLTAVVSAPPPAASVRRQQERPSMEARRRKLDTSALQVGPV